MAIISSSVHADVGIAVATCLVAMFLYFTNAFRYWKRRGVHYVKPKYFLGNFGGVALQKEHIGEYLKSVYDSNPDQPAVGLYAIKTPVLMIRDLDLLRRVMIKDAHAFLDRSLEPSETSEPLISRSLFVLKGKKWRHMRTKLTPTFTSGKLKKMFHLIDECGKQLLSCIEQEMLKGKGVVVKETIARYSTDAIASCAFGVNANALADPHSEFRENTRKIFERTKIQMFVASLLILMPGIVKALKLKNIDESVNNFFRKTFWEVAEYRKKNGIVRHDFVDIMMQMKEEGHIRVDDKNDLEEVKQHSKYTDTDYRKSDSEDVELESDDFVAQAFTFVAAGFETSSSVIAFTLYEVALNPDVQEALRKELQDVLDKHDSQVTYDAIAEMSYLDMVVSEAMRIHPTLPVLQRKCLSNYKIPGTDITIEEGTNILIPVLAIHMDPEIYPDPEKFDPERFSHENKRERLSVTHIPFGEGPRICIGMRFGLLQVKTALVHILNTFQVTPCAETPQPPLGIKNPVGVNIPKKDIVLAFEKIA